MSGLERDLTMSDESGHASQEKARKQEAAENPAPESVLRAEELFQGRREIWIELEGVRYRLRITRRNKLILQK